MFVNRYVWGVSMNSQRNRRLLVAFLYAFIGVLIVLALQKRILGFMIWLIVLAFINPLIFGHFMFWGKKYGGLLKPFHQSPESPNDERELAARDAAHFRAYTTLLLLLSMLLFIPVLFAADPFNLDWLSRYADHLSPTEILFYTRTSFWGLLAVAETLPQAILLWTEPDIEGEPRGRDALTIPRHLR